MFDSSTRIEEQTGRLSDGVYDVSLDSDKVKQLNNILKDYNNFLDFYIREGQSVYALHSPESGHTIISANFFNRHSQKGKRILLTISEDGKGTIERSESHINDSHELEYGNPIPMDNHLKDAEAMLDEFLEYTENPSLWMFP